MLLINSSQISILEDDVFAKKIMLNKHQIRCKFFKKEPNLMQILHHCKKKYANKVDKCLIGYRLWAQAKSNLPVKKSAIVRTW